MIYMFQPVVGTQGGIVSRLGGVDWVQKVFVCVEERRLFFGNLFLVCLLFFWGCHCECAKKKKKLKKKLGWARKKDRRDSHTTEKLSCPVFSDKMCRSFSSGGGEEVGPSVI